MAELIKDGYKPTGADNLAYIGLEHINQQSLSLNSIGHSTEVESNKFVFRSGDILFGKLRPYFRKVYRPRFEGVCSTDIWVVRAKGGIDQGYLFYLIANQEFVDLASSGSSGTRMPRADWDYLKDTQWSKPPEAEQRAIAKILSDLDAKIELNHQMNKTLESIAQTIFKQWFVDFEFPGHEKTTFVNGLPEGWVEEKLGDFADILNGFAFKSEDFVDSGVFLLRTRNFTEDGYVMRDNTACLPESFYDGYKGFRLKKFDVLLVMVGASVGKMAIVQSSVLPALQNQNMWNFRSKSESGQVFLNFLVKKIVQENLGTASGSARDFFRKDYFRSIDFNLPDERLLRDFDECVGSLFDQIDKNLTESQILSQIRDSLLPRLMSGKIRVN
jgi:type I restriction enzyme S subunit